MARQAQFLWVILRDGRSLVARCDGMSRQALARTLDQHEQVLRLESPELSVQLPVSEVECYAFFDTPPDLMPQSGLYDFAAI